MFNRMPRILAKIRGREDNYPASNRVQHSILREYGTFSIENGLSKIQVTYTFTTADVPSIQQGLRPAPAKEQ